MISLYQKAKCWLATLRQHNDALEESSEQALHDHEQAIASGWVVRAHAKDAINELRRSISLAKHRTDDPHITHTTQHKGEA